MLLKALLVPVLLFFCLQLFAADIATSRKNFLYAEEALKNGNLNQYYKLKPLLADYSLYPYLQYAEINRMMRYSLPSEHVKKFLTTYPDSALALRLQTHWLKTLAAQQQWQLYEQFYQPSSDVALQCYDIWAEYKNTQNTKVLEKAKPLWVKGASQPDACNALFAAWQKSPYFKAEYAWDRTQLAMKNNQLKLVSYLERFLTPTQKASVDDWLEIQTLKQSIRNNTESALVQFEKTKNQLTPEQRGQLTYAFAIEMATDHDPRAMTWLDAVPAAQKDTPIYEWRVRYALRQQDWPNVLRYIEEMPPELKQQAVWQYWQGRALLALDQPNQASPILQALAKERHYHGMLASDLLNQAYTLNHAVYPVDAKTKASVSHDPGIQRAIELYALDRLADARREWNTSMAHFDEAQLQAASQLARTLNWHDRGILTASEAVDRNNLDVRFPLAYKDTMKSAANRNKIDPAWAFAIARQESAFLPDAQSSAGAVGLMQLLPSTAQQVARQKGHQYTSSNQLTIPEKNIALGTAYLRDLSVKFDGNMVLASAAYNAGATRVFRWSPNEELPTDIWVETIPFKETRNYIQNVSSYWVIYNNHLGIDDQRINHHAAYIQPL